MATAEISSAFVIRVAQSGPGAEVINIANPGRSLRIQSVTILWVALQIDVSTSTVQVAKVASGGAVSNLFSVAMQGSRTVVPVWLADASPSNVTNLQPDANSLFGSTDNIRVTVVGAATQVEVMLNCMGNPSQALTVS